MGTWGTGNFEADDPREFLVDQVGRWEKLITRIIDGKLPRVVAAFEFEAGIEAAEACAMPLVEIIIVVAERLDPDYLPSSEKVERWRSDYLALFDRETGGPDADAEFVTQRRGVIDNTFSRLQAIIATRPHD